MQHRAGPPMLLKGFAPLVVAVLLAVLSMFLVPSVAPEQIVTVPVEGDVTTTVEDAP